MMPTANNHFFIRCPKYSIICILAFDGCKFTTMTIRAKIGAFLPVLMLTCHSSIIAWSQSRDTQPQSIGHDQSTDTWTIHADSIDPAHYFGVTVANGMIGIVSSADPFRAKDIVLQGAFDLYGRGRVSNILKTFNFINLNLDIDGNRISKFSQVSRLRQVLDMKNACLTTTFNYQDKA